MKQRARVLRGLDRMKRGAGDKLEKEHLKTLEEDLAQYVILRPIERRINLIVTIDFALASSKPSRKTRNTLSKKTPRTCCGNCTSSSTWPIGNSLTLPSAARSM